MKKNTKVQSNLKISTNGEQQHLFQNQVKPLVSTAKNGIANWTVIAFVPYFEQDVDNLDILSNRHDSNGKSSKKAKTNELESWKKQEVYWKKEDIGQS